MAISLNVGVASVSVSANPAIYRSFHASFALFHEKGAGEEGIMKLERVVFGGGR